MFCESLFNVSNYKYCSFFILKHWNLKWTEICEELFSEIGIFRIDPALLEMKFIERGSCSRHWTGGQFTH